MMRDSVQSPNPLMDVLSMLEKQDVRLDNYMLGCGLEVQTSGSYPKNPRPMHMTGNWPGTEIAALGLTSCEKLLPQAQIPET